MFSKSRKYSLVDEKCFEKKSHETSGTPALHGDEGHTGGSVRRQWPCTFSVSLSLSGLGKEAVQYPTRLQNTATPLLKNNYIVHTSTKRAWAGSGVDSTACALYSRSAQWK